MSRELHIGLILPSLPGYSETFIHNKIAGLVNHGFKVSLFVAGKGDSEFVNISVPVHYQVNVKYKFNLLIVLTITLISNPIICFQFLRLEITSHGDWTKALKNLIINSHIMGKPLDWLHFGFATTAIGRENVAKAIGARLAVSFRGFDIGLYPHQHPGCYDLLWKKIDKVHTISDDLYQKALGLGLDPKAPCKKITPAINTELFKSNPDDNYHRPLRIITVGRLTWKKGYEYALKAIKLLKDQQIDFEYHIIGEGYYREAIIYAIYQLKLTENVKLLGQIPHGKVKDEMEWADIYIQPSIQEGFCNAVLEAQAMGLLSIVTDAEGLSENVLDGTTGWVVPKRSPDKIAAKIIDILSIEDEELNNIRESAVYRVQSKFNLEVQANQFRMFYD